MKSLNKLLMKVFSVMLSIMLLNISAFASRYATINNNYSGPGLSGLQVHLFGTKTNPLIYSNYTENSGNGGAFLIEQGSNIGIDTYYVRFNSNTAVNGGAVAQMSTFDPNNFQNAGFENNKATNNGGAIYISDGRVDVWAEPGEECWFDSNKSTNNGGAVYNSGGSLCVGSDSGKGGKVYFRSNKAEVSGGAIYNYRNAETQIRDYVVFSTNTADVYGGAIYNESNGEVSIGSFSSFIDNSAQSSGGAIYNKGDMTINSFADFLGNQVIYNGGAVYNSGSLAIWNNATFDKNKNTNTASNSDGGAIYNVGSVILGHDAEFYENSSVRHGGAIYSCGETILNINEYVNFSSNTAVGNGGAIYNYSFLASTTTIGRKAKFSNNKSTSGDGGAIYNYGCKLKIGDSSDFVGNSANRNGGAIFHGDLSTVATMDIQYGAIFKNNTAGNNGGAISFITNDMVTIGNGASFIKNSAGNYGGAIESHGYVTADNSLQFSSNTAKYGGAIANSGGGLFTLGNGTSFYGNEAEQDGGAIYNNQFSNILNMTDIGKGNINIGLGTTFNKNTALGKGGAVYNAGSFTLDNQAAFKENSSVLEGGAVYNTGTFVSGYYLTFNGNDSSKSGGAIYNTGTSTIEQDSTFRNNLSNVNGGAIYNKGSFYVGGFSQFDQNYACGDGGAIYNEEGTVTIAAGAGGNPRFTYNESESNGGAVYNLDSTELYGVIFDGNKARKDGGAIYNVDSLTLAYESTFNNNSAGDYGGAIYNIGCITSTYYAEFTNNSSNGDGGAIYNDEGHIQIGPYSTFSSNRAVNGVGGAINNNNGEVIIGYDAEFTNNSAEDGGGAIRNSALGTVKIVGNANFTGNTSNFGGAIENYGTITFTDGVKFENNTAEISGGGAILNSGTLNLTANYYPVEFTGNTSGGEQIAIYNQQNSTLNLWANKNVRFVFNDKITSNNSSGNTLNINQSSGTAPTNGTIELNADMSGYKGTVNLYNGTIELCENGRWFGGDLTVSNSPTIDMANNFISEHNFNNLTINNVLNLNVEADLANAEMDTISATSFGNAAGKINVKAINILSDIDENEMIEIAFADDLLKDKVESVDKASSRLYNYKVRYDQNTGYFRFINGALTKNMGTAATAVSATAGGAATQSLVANQVFASMDGKTSSGKKASMDPSNLYVSAGDQVFDNSGKIERGLWLKPFVAQETVKIGDADVDNNLYGTLAGIDFPVGEDKQVSFYLGYAGSKQEIEDVKSNQTGYVLGATGMVMKDSWYAGLTANVMFNKASIDTDFGTDDVDMNMFSFAAKAGYNYNITNSFVLEPNLTLVYGVVNSQEYETSQGAQIDSQSISNISVEPQVKAKFEIGNGWQPYGLLGYSANLGSKPTVKTDGVELELDSIDGYVEYGAGVNKDFIGTVWSCYAQVTGRSGGRNGFAGNLGLKYKF